MATVIKDTNFNMRMNSQRKAVLENLFLGLGMTLPEAVNIFFEKSLQTGGLPFEVCNPSFNYETELAFAEADAIAKGELETPTFDNLDDFFAYLEQD